MSTIMLISDNKSFITSSLVQQLEDLEHTVNQVGSDLSVIEKIKEMPDAFLVSVDESLVNEMQLLIYLKDKSIEQDIPMLLVGDLPQLEKVEQLIPRQFIKKRFLRPINVKEVADEINDFLTKDTIIEKKRILVVDDSGAMLRNVKGWLEDKYSVILANSATVAIKYLAMKHPDLILLDYEMPHCDGAQALEMIRSDVEFSNIPVIFLTSKNDRETVMKVTSLKPDGYLLKTMEPVQIVKTIDNFFLNRELNRK